MRARALALALALGLAAALGVTRAVAQAADEAIPAVDGAPGTPEELAAFATAESGNFVRARELGEAIVRAHPGSYVGHLVLASAHHYGEANFPLAVYHAREALRLFEARHGRWPTPAGPWRWHAQILRELAASEQEVEDYEEALAVVALYNERYQPRLEAARAWALMKLGRYDEARLAAAQGMATGDPNETRIALNALCAIEFEAGHDRASYDACRRALEQTQGTYGRAEVVDLSNFAEAARSLFRLDEAESVLLQATATPEVSYANPWRELAELYLREARFPEALEALQQIQVFRAIRPPHMRNADVNEDRRAVSSFLLVAGESDEARRITEQALVLVDRRYHNSRDPAQDRAVAALLDRAARRQKAEQLRETTAARPWYERLWAGVKALGQELSAWRSGREAVRVLSERAVLVGTFRIGTSESGIMPPWLVSDLVDVLGPGVVEEAAEAARAGDHRPDAGAYYAAIEAEAALARGDTSAAITRGRRALAQLPPGEALLLARVHAVVAEAARDEGRGAEALASYMAALERDPGVFRRLGHPLPVALSGAGPLADEVLDAVARSPRFERAPRGLPVRVEADGAHVRVCLYGPSEERIGCGEVRRGREDERRFVQRAVDAFHGDVFAPRVDLSQGAIRSLDGSNRVSRDALESLVGPLLPPPPGDDAEEPAPP
jgi:tetratricopeptide (TPR) repeat protein